MYFYPNFIKIQSGFSEHKIRIKLWSKRDKIGIIWHGRVLQQEEYESEGLEWVHIDYFNNQIICDLVDLPHKGVLALMDEACLNVGKSNN